MSLSTILSKLSRLGLLSVFCAGLFIASGELRMSPVGDVQIGNRGIQSAMAADATATAKKEANSAMIDGLIDLATIVISVLSYVLAPLIMLAGWLLSPDWTFGEIFGLRPILHQLWILISNVVYVIFGFMLVGVAFANIFGAGGAEYEMKKMLPKLVMGMLIVPFTWFIVSAVLSISNILTASVIQLPVATINQAVSNNALKAYFEKPIIPKYTYIDLTTGNSVITPMEAGSNTKSKNGDMYTVNCDNNPNDCVSIKTLLSDEHGGAYNLLTVYAYGIFNIEKIKKLEADPLKKTIHSVVDIVKKLGFGFIYFLVFGILLIAIVYALFTRAIILWMFAIFSPLFALNFVLGGSKSKALEKLTKFDIKHFISLALVPVYVSAALAFGLMFLSLVMNSQNYTSTTNSVTIDGSNGVQGFHFGNGNNAIHLITFGSFDDSEGYMKDAFATGQGVISTIILGFLALVILWMAVMAALGADDITAAAVKPISDMGNSVGELMKSAPQYVPLPGMNGQSMKSMTQGVSNVKGGIEQVAAGKAGEITKMFGLEDAAKRNQAKAALDSAVIGGENAAMKKAYNNLKDTYSNYNEMKNDSGAMDLLKKMAVKTGGNSNAADMTELISSIDKGMELKGYIGGLDSSMNGSADKSAWEAHLQSVVSKKISDDGGKDGTSPTATKKDSKIEIQINAGNSASVDLGTTYDIHNTTQLAEKLMANANLKGELTADEWKNALQNIVTNESERVKLIEELKKHTDFLKKIEEKKDNTK